jgi:GT2 family glycosyltransferase
MISIIVSCFNQLDLTKAFLLSLPGNTTNEYEVILIDDASTDATSLLKEKDFGIDKLIRHTTNSGIPKGMNEAVAIAEGEYLALFNNDILVGKDWDSPLIKALIKYPFLGVVGGQMLYSKSYYRSFPKKDINDIIVWLKGHPFFMTKIVFNEIGEWDKQFYPSWYDDTDFLVRAAFKGYKFALLESSYCYHAGSATLANERISAWGNWQHNSRTNFKNKWNITTDDIDLYINYAKIFDEKKIEIFTPNTREAYEKNNIYRIREEN